MIDTKKEFYGSCHTHLDSSNYRLRDCIIKLEPLCEYALELGHNFVAITDHETVSSFLHCQEVEEEIRKKHPDFKIIKEVKIDFGTSFYWRKMKLALSNFMNCLQGRG